MRQLGRHQPPPDRPRDYATADWDALFAVNVRATFLVCRAVGDALLAAGRSGSIVNLSSQMGVVGYPGRTAYCATKHAVEGLTEGAGRRVGAARDPRQRGRADVRRDAASPARCSRDAEFAAEVRRRIPTGELATVEQVADAVRYLACDASGSVTGASLPVDGGWTAW